MPTYPISPPPASVATQKLVLNRRQSVAQSSFTYVQSTVQTASQWQLEFTFPVMRASKAESVAAWINSLYGQIGSFLYYPRQSFTSALTGRNLAKAGYAYGSAINATGWTANGASGLRLGQYFNIGNQLLQITSAAASADGSGQVLIEFQPELRETFAAGTAINFATPSIPLRLTTSDGQGYTLTPDKLADFGTLQAAEAV